MCFTCSDRNGRLRQRHAEARAELAGIIATVIRCTGAQLTLIRFTEARHAAIREARTREGIAFRDLCRRRAEIERCRTRDLVRRRADIVLIAGAEPTFDTRAPTYDAEVRDRTDVIPSGADLQRDDRHWHER
jgi:hypothetical protein